MRCSVNPAPTSSETQLFVVHVWRQRSRFRAAVRRVDDDRTQLFTNTAQLARYLAAEAAAMSIPTPSRRT